MFERMGGHFEHLRAYAAADPLARVDEIIAAIDVLTHSPLIGRPASGHLRELVIGRRSRGYVALCRYVSESDVVFVLAIRAQREAGRLLYYIALKRVARSPVAAARSTSAISSPS